MPQTPVSLEAERSVLGAVLLDGTAIAKITDLEPDDFYSENNAAIYRACRHLFAKGEHIDLVTVSHALEVTGELNRVGGSHTIASIQEETPTSSNIESYAEIVKDKALKRRVIAAGEEMMEAGLSPTVAGRDAVAVGQRSIYDLANHTIQSKPESMLDLVTSYVKFAQSINGSGITGIRTAFPSLDRLLHGMKPGELTYVAARPGMGKAQPVWTPVLTPTGWRAIGALGPGDRVIGANGKPTKVLAVHDRGRLPVYRAEFSDGSTTRCCGDHLWATQSHNDRKSGRPGFHVSNTTEIKARLDRVGDVNNREFHIPIVKPVEFGGRDLPVDPYVMGVLLGDGGLTNSTPRITSADPEIVHEVAKRLPEGVEIKRVVGSYSYSIKRVNRIGNGKNPIQTALLDLGCLVRSENKSIPDIYLLSSVEQRILLLQGLMDTDGWRQRHSAIFASASERLVDDVIQLVRSLGGIASKGNFKKNKCRGSWGCHIRLPEGVSPFRLGRKRIPWTNLSDMRKYRPDRKFVSITEDGYAECRCLTVEASDGLYVTENFIVTHNSALAMALGWNAARQGFPVLFFSLEMSKESLVERMIAADADIEKPRLDEHKLSDNEWERMIQSAGRLGELPLYIDEQSPLDELTMMAKARQLTMQVPLKVVIVDYVQILRSSRDWKENRAQEVGYLSMALKGLAKELRVPVIALSQLSRAIEHRDNKRPMLSDLRDSGSLEQDADVVIGMYRDGYYHPEKYPQGTLEPVELLILKHRNGPTGKVVLNFERSKTRFEEQ